MRLTLKFLVKSFLAVITIMFLLPVIMNHLDSVELQKATKNAKRKAHHVKRDSDFEYDSLPNIPQRSNEVKTAPKVKDNVLRYQDIEDGAGGGQPIVDKVKVYGPKAVYNANKRGNFEPSVVKKSGPGQNGEPVYTSMSEQTEADKSVREFGFNMVASDKISMDRTIPDTRLDECKHWQYPTDLPSVSVVIVFHNEGWSTLMRTVHSVIEMSPTEFLKEVIMVDDYSNKVHLKEKLDEYIKQFNGLVKLYRNKERVGLIGTRTLGAKYSTADVVLFLDAHCECNRNWLVPLLARIAYDRTILAVPIIDGIDWNNFRYSPVYGRGEHFRGIFEWGFLYKESSVPKKELDKREYDSEPYWSPTHAGGLFAIDRKYFFELGAYDPGLQIWGGENFELSFKIWLTGGSVEWVPCSHVGHIYRNSMPYGFGKISSKIPIVLLNYMRVVEVWMEPEFQDYFYTREPTIRGYPVGNISKQLEFKKKHQVHSFKWFMDNIAYEVWEKFPPPPPNLRWGEIKHLHTQMCWDTMGQQAGGGQIGVSSCHHYGGNQLYRLNTKGQLAVGERCIDNVGYGMAILYCPVAPIGPWVLEDSGLIRHKTTDKCAHIEGQKLELHKCDVGNKKQLFEMNKIRTWSLR